MIHHARRLLVPFNMPIPLELREVAHTVRPVVVRGHDGTSCRLHNLRFVDFACDLCPMVRFVGDIHSAHFDVCLLTCPEWSWEGT